MEFLSLADTEPVEAAIRGVLSTCVDIHERHRHEFRAQRISRVLAGRHLSTLKS
jgi:hypothetical protein